MGQSGGNRSNVDRELGRMDSEYSPYIANARGPNGDFGRGESGALRDEVLQGFRSGTGYSPYRPTGGYSNGGSSYGGDVNWNNATMGDTGSARGTYEDFSRTGGVDATALRRRATAQIPAFYDQYKQSAQRRANVQGGYSPGFDAQQAEIARQAGREGFNASRQVEGDIAQMVQQGRLAGASGLMGLGGMETDLNKFNTSGAFSAAEGNANRRQSAGQFDAGLGLDWARFGEGQNQFGAEFGEGQRRYNTSGLAGLYGNDIENYYRNLDNYYKGISGRAGNAQNLIFNRTEPQSNVGKFIGGLAGLGTSIIGMGRGSRRPQVTGPWEAGGGG